MKMNRRTFIQVNNVPETFPFYDFEHKDTIFIYIFMLTSKLS
jgi:hypothetical protein